MNDQHRSRRQFLQSTGGALGATWLALHWPDLARAAQHAHQVAAGRIDHSFQVLTPGQARDVDAIAAQIVPSGSTPGAREAGVVYFIDSVHAGIYAARRPAFLADLAAFQAECTRSHPDAESFAGLDGPTQLAHLESVAHTPFFETMRQLTVCGLLALPSYGGNQNKLGWQLVGFVDQHAWSPPFGHYDRDYAGFVPYSREPRS